ncbi:MAG: ClpX C4-type zinc finger protein [Candidatus Obscuribacterales bacterium]
MSKLKCDWCGKDSDELETLIVGLIANICNRCVTFCLQEFSRKAPEEWKPKRAKCSFCWYCSSSSDEKLISGDGVYICLECVHLCVEKLEEKAAERAAGSEADETGNSDDEHADCACEHREWTPKEKEWLHLANEASDDKDFLKQGRVWLKENKSDEAAGKAIAMLLELRPSASLVADGLSWLVQQKSHDSAPELVAELLKADPSVKTVRLAGWYLKTSDDVRSLGPIIQAILESPPHKGLYKKIEDLLERNPTADTWSFNLLVTSKVKRESVQGFVLKWLRLNVRNPEAYASVHISRSKSPEIIEAAFDWARRGGRTSDNLPSTLERLVPAAANNHRSILPGVVRVARAWLKENPDHEVAGRVYASVLSATGSKLDIGRAKQWHQEHRTSPHAWNVISDILNYGYCYNRKPDEYSVKEAQLLLRAEASADRKSHVVGTLLGAHADDESIAWAKEAYARDRAPWILIRLLLRAPDVETIVEAEAAFARLKDREDTEPEMIYAVLRADPRNKVALRRGRVWLKRSPENKWIKAVTPLIRKAGKRKA